MLSALWTRDRAGFEGLGGLLVEFDDPNIRAGIAIFVHADLLVPARREHEELSIERNVAEWFGPEVLVIPDGAVVSKSPDGGGIEICFDAEDLAVIGLLHVVLAIGTCSVTGISATRTLWSITKSDIGILRQQ